MRVRTTDGTARAGTDYTAVPLTTITFTAGQQTATVSIAIAGAAPGTPVRACTLTLASPSQDALIADAAATIRPHRALTPGSAAASTASRVAVARTGWRCDHRTMSASQIEASTTTAVPASEPADTRRLAVLQIIVAVVVVAVSGLFLARAVRAEMSLSLWQDEIHSIVELQLSRVGRPSRPTPPTTTSSSTCSTP